MLEKLMSYRMRFTSLLQLEFQGAWYIPPAVGAAVFAIALMVLAVALAFLT